MPRHTARRTRRAKELVFQTLPGPGEPGYCASMILIPGALGEKEGTEGAHEAIHSAIQQSRRRNPATPVFVGGNCLGIRSRPGSYDTFFVPASKLDPRREVPAKRCALVSQSGAFLITRMSNLEYLDPCLAISIGNQVDLTVSDLVQAVAARDDVDCVGVYVEGFNDLDGLALLRAVEQAVANGKVAVFYKAGRTSAGRDAAKGHTASVAGDYDVCQAAMAAAGAIVCDTFKEFEQLLELATHLHGKTVGGNRIGAISNAGYEAVGMADTVKGARYDLDMPALGEASARRLQEALTANGLSTLVDAKNPLDLTPMVADQAYEDCIRAFLDAPEVDALVVGCVPMTPAMLTTPEEIVQASSIAQRIPKLFAASTKPLVFVIDCKGPYAPMARANRESGVPLFRTADQAVRSLGRYLGHRTAWGMKPKPRPSDRKVDHANHQQHGVATLA